jgi:dihydroxy-acid dehydratase
MGAKKQKSGVIFDESDFPVSVVRRTVFQGTGADMEETSQKPMIAVANSCTEINPGHMHLSTLATRVKEGIHSAGGIPFEFNVPAPCDGISLGHEGMRFILAQRDLIADMVETHIRSMRFDGVVMIASCDKIIPGMIMAAARLDLPTIFLTGGPNLFNIRFKTTMKGSISHKDYEDLGDKFATASCASCGACEIMGTANTFQCLSEALGLTIPGSANVPAYHSEKLQYARKTGKRIVEMVDEELTARKILTQKALENALIIDLAIGGSTNVTLHLPAIASCLERELPLAMFNEYNRKIPTYLGIAPNGPHGIHELYMAGGIPAVMKRVEADLNLDALNVTGNTMADVVKEAVIWDETVIPKRENARLPEGGTVILTGNLAPDGAVVKQSAVAKDMLVFKGPARVFESEAACLEAIREDSLVEGEVLVIRNEGPKGAPGMPEMLAVTMALDLRGYQRLALITDGRFSGATSGPCIGHISPEAYSGGPIALIREGDEISIDIPGRTLTLMLSDQELADRRQAWTPVVRETPSGYMERYRKHVGPASGGAVLE